LDICEEELRRASAELASPVSEEVMPWCGLRGVSASAKEARLEDGMVGGW
jgi:hypothetical protein